MDFNIRYEDEIHFSKEQQVDDMLELFLQEIDVLFSTEKGKVFGNRQLGNSTEALLWKTTFNTEYMQLKLIDDIKQDCYMNEHFSWDVEVKLLHGTVKDIALIDVIIKDKLTSTELATKKFQFR